MRRAPESGWCPIMKSCEAPIPYPPASCKGRRHFNFCHALKDESYVAYQSTPV